MNSNRSGFTVVEMLIAVVILGIGLMALAAGSGTVTRTLQGSRITTQAAQLAAWRMDYLRAASRAALAPCTHGNFAPGNGTMYAVQQTWTIEAIGALRKINVISTYSMGRGKTRSDTLTSTVNCS